MHPVDRIIFLVSINTGVAVREILGSDRTPRVIRARQTAMYLARKLTNASYPDLGNHFNRHHTTVMHGVETTANRDSRVIQLVRAAMEAHKGQHHGIETAVDPPRLPKA